MKKLAVFMTQEKFDRVIKKGFLSHRRLGHVPVEAIINIKLSTDNPTWKPIALDKTFIRRVKPEIIEFLLNRVIDNARKNGQNISTTIWYDSYERDQGVPSGGIAFNNNITENAASELLASMENTYGKDGCAEIRIGDCENEIAVYHEEHGDIYVLPEIFELAA